MAEALYRLGRFSARRPWTIVVAWILILGIAGVGFALGRGTLASDFSLPGTPTTKVTDLLKREFPSASGASGSVVVSTRDGGAFTAAQKEGIAGLIADAKRVDGVSSVTDPFASETRRAERAQKIQDARAQLDAGQRQLDAGRAQLDAGRQQLADGRARLQAAETQAVAAGAAGARQLAGIRQQLAGLDGQEQALGQQSAALDASQKKLDAQSATLERGAGLLDLARDVRLVSDDGSAAVIPVSFRASGIDIPDDVKAEAMRAFQRTDVAGVRVDFSSEIAQTVPQILGAGEVVGVVIAAIVLIVMLGSLVVAGLPLLTALVGVAIAALGALAFSGLIEMVSVTPVLGIMLGLAVGIDYALFIVNRHRRQLRTGADVHGSIALAVGTSGNAVVFAGSTVLIALLALNLTGIPFLGLMGTVGAGAILVSVLVAITLTPALLGLLGHRALSRRERRRRDAAVSAPADPRPVRITPRWRSALYLVAGIAVLGVIAIPSASLRLAIPDGSSEPVESTQYRAYSVLAKSFGAGQNGPLVVVARLERTASAAEAQRLQLDIGRTLARRDGVVGVAPIGVSASRSVAAYQVVPKGGPTSVSTERLVKELRGLRPDGARADLGVAGRSSGQIDISDTLSDALPGYLAVVIGLSLLILLVVFRSIIVPLTATAGFLLSLFAALGGVVAVYQWGWLAPVFGVHDPGPILNFVPTIAVGVLFGLAMDYQLFLVSGMREAHAHGAPARQAVVQGFRAGRPVVTAAAIIMVSVFGGFVFSESSLIRPIGFSLAFGVLADAFVVRMLLIPAVMNLVGRAAWWLPRWLDRILPNVDVEGARLERSHPVTGEQPLPAHPSPVRSAVG